MTPQTLDRLVDAGAHDALRTFAPRLVGAISDLLAQGVAPAQIEDHVRIFLFEGAVLVLRPNDNTQLMLYIRHCAEHLARIG